MDGLASTSSSTNSLLPSATKHTADATNADASGSTAAAELQSSLQDIPISTDQDSEAPVTSTLSPNVPSNSDAHELPSTEIGNAQDAGQATEVNAEGHNKGQGALHEEQPSDGVAIKEEGEVLLVPANGQIELLEHTDSAILSESALSLHDDGSDWLPESDQELKRVKVYELIGSRWIDQGTAFCFGQFTEDSTEALLIARSERNYSDIILSTTIRGNDVYQRQQDTLIVWTEPDGVDYALSFQDPEGCSEVWNFILEVQRHMNTSDDRGSSPLADSVTTANVIRSGHLPAPQLGVISEIERVIKALARTQAVKERICEYIQHEDYIKALIKVMHTAEDLESLENLHALCSLMQTILMLNDHSIYEHILEDDIFFGVVGMLEYDPDFPGHKANYREFLNNTAEFHQPIPMRDLSIQRKIHHTYRLQFLKDVVLARALDDSTFNVLNSCIIFNQIDIINYIQQDAVFLRDVVRLFVDEDMLTGGIGPNQRRNTQFQPAQGQAFGAGGQGSPQQQQQQLVVISLNGNGDNMTKPEPAAAMEVDQKPAPTGSSPKAPNGALPAVNGRKRSGAYAFAPPDDLTPEEINLRREVIFLLQQLCIMGKNIQLGARITLFRTLVDRGVLFAVQWALGLSEKENANKLIISAAGEVLSALLDHDLNGVRGHILKQVVAIEKEREAKKRGADKAETILELACRIMAQSTDVAVQSQVGDALKVWLDLPTTDNNPGSSDIGPKLPNAVRKDDPGTERFMDFLYKECIPILFRPFKDVSDWRSFQVSTLPLNREQTNRFVYLCDLLHNFLQQHSFRSHVFVITSDVLSRIATLFKAKDKHLRHSAFRIFRLLLKQGNPNSHAQVMKQDILKPILDLTIKESMRDNLLSCSCQEYFEHMRKENLKDMIRFCMTTHEAEIQQLAKSPLGSQRFDLFIRRYEMNQAPPPEETVPEKPPSEDRIWGAPGRLLDLAEEDYFNGDDDDDDDIIPSISQQSQFLKTSPLSLNNTGMKRKRRPGITGMTKGYRPPLKTPQLNSLVDYDEDDDDDTPPTPGQTAESSAHPSPSASSPDSKHSSLSPSSRSPSPSLASTSTLQEPKPSGPPPKRLAKDEDEVDTMEALVQRGRSRSQSPSPSLGPMRPSEKRRREDDEDEEVMARIGKASKKPDLGAQKDPAGSIARSKNGDDPPGKKIKLKIGAVGLAVASTSPAQGTLPSTSASEPHKKDGDTG
ncbi:hypothetical protein D9619_000547 [Psilocybe cf. subviscida]|uniref:Serine/threonine-protein phosphatase 4 regulatory subunit 3-like central domain-containing protein n=1 Tax=Psilocybe cf. subviscida TaxID=2480587 RepID=A0A8H5F3G4_9AGAR|nr:hypothetical protein D9619_000547 [Psilocybe cf. subviscida]